MRRNLSLLVLAMLAYSAFGQSVFMTATGTKAGQIKGGVIQKGRESQVRVLSVDHEIVVPRAGGGMATGKRQHKPFVVEIEVDASMPIFQNAMVTNEVLKDVTFRFWLASTPGVTGGSGPSEVQAYTVRLTNATVTSTRLKTPEGGGRATLLLSLAYEKIEWTWNQGGFTATDSTSG